MNRKYKDWFFYVINNNLWNKVNISLQRAVSITITNETRVNQTSYRMWTYSKKMWNLALLSDICVVCKPLSIHKILWKLKYNRKEMRLMVKLILKLRISDWPSSNLGLECMRKKTIIICSHLFAKSKKPSGNRR